MEERFKQLAALVGQSTRFSSSSTVVLNKVTHKVRLGLNHDKPFDVGQSKIPPRHNPIYHDSTPSERRPRPSPPLARC